MAQFGPSIDPSPSQRRRADKCYATDAGMRNGLNSIEQIFLTKNYSMGLAIFRDNWPHTKKLYQAVFDSIEK